MKIILSTLAAFPLAGAAPAGAAAPVVLTLQSLATPSQDTANTASVWADKIAANNAFFTANGNPPPYGQNAPFAAESALLNVGGRQVFVSVSTSLQTCDSDNSGLTTYGVCSVRLAVVDGGGLKTSDAGQACFTYPSSTSTTQDFTYAVPSADGKTIALNTYSGGARVPDCDRTLTVP